MKEKIREIVVNSLNELNETLDEKIYFNEDVILIGESAVLDSFDFVNLTVLIEESISDELDKEITLVNEKAFSRKNSPFKNINSLTDYILELIEEK
ncbi:MAG: hypothetical protein ACRC4T_15765 [Cetobacterium sp.]